MVVIQTNGHSYIIHINGVILRIYKNKTKALNIAEYIENA